LDFIAENTLLLLSDYPLQYGKKERCSKTNFFLYLIKQDSMKWYGVTKA